MSLHLTGHSRAAKAVFARENYILCPQFINNDAAQATLRNFTVN